MTLTPGTTVGRYQILEPLGQGGMATVYKAFQPSLQREVALKVLRPGYAQDQEFRERFEREAIAIAKLRHPNIVQVFDFEVSQSGEYVLAMEFLEGGTLKDRLLTLAGEGRGIDPEQAVRIIGEVAEALGYAHEKGIVHRDVKPSNVMLTQRDRAVVTDFGIARILGATSHTQTGVGIGTPEYMAPEQGQGGQIDHRADIYSLGAMAYELLTGRVPYSADTPLAIVLAHIKDPLPLPSKVNPSIGKGIERTLLKALAKDPAQRFDSATAFADALRAGLAEDARGGTMPTVVVRGSAGAAPSVRTRVAPPGRPGLTAIVSRRPVQLGIAGALVLTVVTGSVLASGALRGPAASAAPSAVPAPGATPSAAAGIPKGRLVWEAKLDGGATKDIGLQDVGPAGAKTTDVDVRQLPGAIEIESRTAPFGAGFLPNTPARESYVYEIEGVTASGTLTVYAKSGANQGYPRVGIRVAGGAISLTYQQASAAAVEEIAPPRTADIVAGRPFSLAIVVEESRYAVYSGGKLVTQAVEQRVQGAYLPRIFYSGPVGAPLRITGLRMYEIGSPAAVASSPTATPTPKPIATPGPTWGNPPQEMQTRLAQFSVRPQVARVGDIVTLSLDVGAAWGCDGTVQQVGLNYAQVSRPPGEAQLVDWSPKQIPGRADARVETGANGGVRWVFGTPPAMPPNCPPGTVVNTQPVGLKLTATYQILKPTDRWDAVYAQAQNNQGDGFAQLPFGVVSD